METKQTAVKSAFNKLRMLNVIDEKKYEIFCQLELEAKAMEKEQIKDAFVECWKANVPDGIGIECKLDAEQYYNETYGK